MVQDSREIKTELSYEKVARLIEAAFSPAEDAWFMEMTWEADKSKFVLTWDAIEEEA